jgi:hypothetical protein
VSKLSNLSVLNLERKHKMRGTVVRSILGLGAKVSNGSSFGTWQGLKTPIRISQGTHFYRTVAGGPRSIKISRFVIKLKVQMSKAFFLLFMQLVFISSAVLIQKSRWLCSSAEKAAQELSPEQVELKKLNDDLDDERKKSADFQV